MGSSDTTRRAPTIAIVTVSYRSDAVLGGLLESIEQADIESPVIVVADNAPDGSDRIAALADKYGAMYLPQTDNLGYGAAMNAGAKALPDSIEWILITNPDVVLHPGSLRALRQAMAEDSTIAAVGPAIETDGKIYPSARSIPSLRVGIGHALFANVWLDNPWSRAYRQTDDVAPHRRDAGWLSGACLLVRRSIFEQLGGFDEKYFMYFEDVDLGYRIGKAGYRNVYEPAAVVTHSGAHSTSTESKLMIDTHHQSARRFLSSKYSAWYLLPIRVGLSMGLWLRARFEGRHLTD